jgi:hypothetical protein
MKRWLAIAAMVVGLLGVMMAPAHADPTNAPGAVPLTVTCDGTSYPAVGVPGHGRWAPALITTTNAVLVPFGFAFTVTNLTTGEVIFRDAFSKQPSATRLPLPAPTRGTSPTRKGTSSGSKGPWMW